MTTPVTPPDDFILIGRLGRTFQLQGGLRFYGLGPAETAAVPALRELFVEGVGLREVERVRPVGAQTVVYLSDVRTVEQAKMLVNREVFAFVGALPKVEGEVYIELVIGLPVLLDGLPLGEVVDVVEAGFQDLLVIASQEGERMIPLQADYVRVMADAVRLEDVPEGLLELHRPEG